MWSTGTYGLTRHKRLLYVAVAKHQTTSLFALLITEIKRVYLGQSPNRFVEYENVEYVKRELNLLCIC